MRGAQDQDVLAKSGARHHVREKFHQDDPASAVGAGGPARAIVAIDAAGAAGDVAPRGVARDGTKGGGLVAVAVEPRELALEVEDPVHGGRGSPQLEGGIVTVGGVIFLDGKYDRSGFGCGSGRGLGDGKG